MASLRKKVFLFRTSFFHLFNLTASSLALARLLSGSLLAQQDAGSTAIYEPSHSENSRQPTSLPMVYLFLFHTTSTASLSVFLAFSLPWNSTSQPISQLLPITTSESAWLHLFVRQSLSQILTMNHTPSLCEKKRLASKKVKTIKKYSRISFRRFWMKRTYHTELWLRSWCTREASFRPESWTYFQKKSNLHSEKWCRQNFFKLEGYFFIDLLVLYETFTKILEFSR